MIKKLFYYGVRVLLVLMGLVVVVGLAGSFLVVKTQQELMDQFQLQQGQQAEVGVSQIRPGEIKASYELIEGWNLVALPVRPVNFKTASGLIKDVVKKGGYVTTVSVWDGDRWQEFVQRGKDQFGFDFELEPGEAYFLKNEKEVLWSIVGEPVSQQDLAEYQLDSGWNTLGIVKDELTAQKVIDQINQGEERATVMDWWTKAGNWELFVKRLYENGRIEEYGENFKVNKTNGYMIFIKEPMIWRPR